LRSITVRNLGQDGPVPDPTARTLLLLSLLQTHKFWAGAELAARLETSARTLRRDVDRLRELGYAVDATPGPTGGYRLATGAHLPPLLLDDEEAVAIAVGLRLAAGASVEGIEDTSLRALAKLEQVLPDHLRRRVNAVHTNVASLRWGGDGPTVDAEALAVLALACRDREQVFFAYRSREGADTNRLVEPHQLVSSGRRWYLVAWDVRRTDWRTFRLDRLEAPRLGGVRFDARALPGGDAATFVAASIKAMPSSLSASFEVDEAADVVTRALRWAGVEVEPVDADRCRVRVGADSHERLIFVVAIAATEFELTDLEPAELCARVATVAARLARATP
jgi:predicted DNA-binding transcriptional regulator YafY